MLFRVTGEAAKGWKSAMNRGQKEEWGLKALEEKVEGCRRGLAGENVNLRIGGKWPFWRFTFRALGKLLDGLLEERPTFFRAGEMLDAGMAENGRS